VVKKAPVKKPVAKKPAAVKKPVAKKAVPAKKPALKKPVPAKKVIPSKKAVATRQTASQKSASSKANPKVSKPTVAKKPLPAQSASKSVTTATKTAKAAKTAAAKTPAAKPTPSNMTPPAAEVTKKSPRAAKAMAMMPPPPGQSVASTTAKSSYGPITVPSLPAVVPMIPVKDPKLANNWKTKTADTVTEAEIMAMSDDDYMNAFQLGFFRHKLVQLKNDILVNAGETTEHLREDTVIVPDPADRATIEEEHALELRTRDRERKLLKKIEQSISRIDSGDYGYCDETGEPIGVGRLMARPTATLSLEAQQRRELKQKMFGD
jgi:DnaK suppressor protein